MKKFTLTPNQNGLFSCSLALIFLFLINLYFDGVLDYFANELHPFIQIFVAGILITFVGVLAGISKVRQAGFSGQFRSKQSQYWQQVEIEFTLKGVLSILLYLGQVVIFSLSLYVVVRVMVWYFTSS